MLKKNVTNDKRHTKKDKHINENIIAALNEYS